MTKINGGDLFGNFRLFPSDIFDINIINVSKCLHKEQSLGFLTHSSFSGDSALRMSIRDDYKCNCNVCHLAINALCQNSDDDLK